MNGHFLQSKDWEDFQKSLGRECFLVGEALVVKLPLAAGKSYLYSGGLSNFKNFNFQTLAKQHNAIFLKCEPMVADLEVARGLLKRGFIKSPKEVQPQKTIILDLEKSKEELLAAMHQKARYNIGVAEKHSLKWEVSRKETIFWELIQKTAQRDKFSTHTREYYEKLLASPFAKLFTVAYKNKVIAANIILLYGDTACYLHGASDYEHRNLMAPYLLHWETIKYAKEQGYKKYDLWGIDEKKWPGVTRFKRGFGGREVKYMGSYDYVFQPFWYKLYNLRNAVKKKLR